jgi:hypothetical protein
MTEDELSQFHHSRHTCLSCQGIVILASKQSNCFVRSHQGVRYHTQKIQYTKYYSSLFPKVQMITINLLLETLHLQCHDHITLSHNNLLEATPGMQTSSFVPIWLGCTPPP